MQNNSINYLDFLRAMENSKLSTQPKEEEEAVPIDFATLNPEEVLKNVQKVVASCGPALSTVWQPTRCLCCEHRVLVPSQSQPPLLGPRPPVSTLPGVPELRWVGQNHIARLSNCLSIFDL